MLIYMNSELIKQPFSYEAIYVREYRPTRQNEQYILDYITFFCITIDTYVISTIVSLLWFPDAMHMIQKAALFVLFALYAGKEIAEFIYQLKKHYEFVNAQQHITVPSWGDPNVKYICKLIWRNPDSLLDFRTYTVRVDTIYMNETPPAPPLHQHPYNTRSRARSRPVE